MRRLITTDISDTAQMPIKKGTLEFLQDAHKETLASTIQWLIGTSYDPTKVYILYGCVNSGSGSNYIMSAGAIFLGGEIYQVDAASFSTSGSNVAGWVLAITNFTTDADPVTFTDTNSYNVHNIRKLQSQAVPNTDPYLLTSAIRVNSIPAAVAVETARAIAVETLLLNNITLYNAAWTSDSNVGGGTNWSFGGGSGTVTFNFAKVEYHVDNSKILHVNFGVNFDVVTSTVAHIFFTFPALSRTGRVQVIKPMYLSQGGSQKVDARLSINANNPFTMTLNYDASVTPFPVGTGYLMQGEFTVQLT